MNKKASLTDSIFVPMFILIIACTLFLAVYIWGAFKVNFTPIALQSAANVTLVNAMTDISQGINTFDYMVPLLVGGLLLTSLIFAYKTGASIVYAFVSVFMWVLAVIMAVVFNDIFTLFEVYFPDVASAMPILVYVMHNIKWIALVFAFLISIVMFSRNNQEDKLLAAQEGFYGRQG